MDLTPEQKHWFDEQTQKPESLAFRNPCVRAFGIGPEGMRCKQCVHLYRKHYSKTYIKCELRKNTNGPGSDHKANWPACGKFEAAA